MIGSSPVFDDHGFNGPWFAGTADIDISPDPVPQPGDEGDDRVHAAQGFLPHGIKLTLDDKPGKPATIRVIPHHRDIRKGMRGPDVLALKRALSRKRYIVWPKRWSDVMGPFALKALRKFQRDHHLKVDGVYGMATHRKLVALGGFDKWGALLMGRAPFPGSAKDRLRAAIVAQAMWGYHNRERIHYSQSRPIDGHRRRWKLPLYTDCSGSVTDWYEWAGGPDPNGRHFDGLGYTGTQVARGIKTITPRPADLNFYGWDWRVNGPHHVTIEVGNGWCISHGGEYGPILVKRRYRGDYYQSRSYI